MHLKALCIPLKAGPIKTMSAVGCAIRGVLRSPGNARKTILLGMKLTAIILLSATLQVSAKGFTQQVTLSVKDAPLTEVFKQIKTQTGISFIWDEQVLKATHPVTLSVKNASIKDVLDECIIQQPLTYSIIDNIIVIKSRLIAAAPSNIETPAPQADVTGTVVNQNNEPLAGVTVAVKGKKTMTVTNDDGFFTISADPSDVLVFSYTGYTEQEATVGGKSVINISLVNVAGDLNEVVVVGYGTQRKKDVVGAVGVASRKDFGDVAVSNTSQLIQGKIAGVQVLNGSGEPGAETQIVIRGTGSFTNAAPLYVIDGIQSDPTTFNSLSSFDIQDITVLKDASSVAIYGAQGANGVVIVTTRRPKNRAPKVTYDGYVGFSRPWKQFDMMNAQQYTDFVKDWYVGQGQVLPPRLATPEANITKTDWQDEVFRTGKITEHHINLGGASDKVTYSTSLGYTAQQSQIFRRDYERINFRVNLEERLGRRFKLGQQFNLRYDVRKNASASILNGLRMPPYMEVYDPSNELGGFGIVTSALDGNDTQNPLIQPTLRDIRMRRLNNYLQLYGEVDLVKGLKFRSQFGGTYVFDQDYNYNPTYAGNQLITQSQITESYDYQLSYILENYFTYNKTWGNHSINLTAGNSYRNGGISRNVNLVGSDFPNDAIHQIGVAKTRIFSSGRANSEARFISYYARLNYTFMDRYILSLTTRRDATSLFSEDNRVGVFPSVGLGWRLSEENFMKDIAFISDLKLRASWGKTGNSNIAGFSYQSNVWTGDNNSNSVVYPLGPNEVLINGTTVAIPATPNLKWETTKTTDVGLDASFLNNSLTLSLGYYYRDNQDLLVSVPLALSTGYGGVSGASSKQLINAASAYNRGFEITLGYNGRAGDLNYGITVNGAYNKNQVTSLGTQGAVPIQDGPFYSVPFMTLTDVGHPIGAFYGYVYDHVARDQADIDSYNAQARKITGDPNAEYESGLLPGDRIFKDINGDGVITEADQNFIGSPIPKWNYGLNINLSYRNFDFMAALQGVAGVNIINAMDYYLTGMALPFNGKTDVLNRWKNPGDVTDIARAGQHPGVAGTGNLRPSSWYVENGAYARLRNVTLGYTIPEGRLKQWTNSTVSAFRIYFTAQNLFTITKYSGYDPEVGSGDLIFSRGIDQGAVPQPRTLLVGLQVGF